MARPADRALSGLGVVVTRDEGPDGPLSLRLVEHGATVLHWTAVRGEPAPDPAALAAALAAPGSPDWIALTSPRAVDAVAETGAVLPAGARLAVVGRATADAARSQGWAVDIVAEPHTAEALVAAMAAAGVGPGSRVLFPASEIARAVLEDGLAARGAEVVRVTAYRTVHAAPDPADCARDLAGDRVDVITFTSPSAVAGLRAGLGEGLFREAVGRALVAAIGPTTAEAARAAGAPTVVVAGDHSIQGLTARIVDWATRERGGGDG